MRHRSYLGLPDEEVEVCLIDIDVFVINKHPQPHFREPLDRHGVGISLKIVVSELLDLIYILPVALGVDGRQKIAVLRGVQDHVIVLVEAIEDLVDLLIAALSAALSQRGLRTRPHEFDTGNHDDEFVFPVSTLR